MGYKKIITYILQSELGTSLKASGWQLEAEKCGGDWSKSKARPRQRIEKTLFGDVIKYPDEHKKRHVKIL